MSDFFEIIINCKEEDVEEIIKKRAIELENSVSTSRKIIIPNERDDDYQSYYFGFIKSDVKIYPSIGYGNISCYTLANYNYLVEIFKKIRKYNIKNKNDVLKYLSNILDDYFGKFSGSDKREEFIVSLGGNITIDSFEGKGLAACSERSAVTNNVLEMLGIKAIFVTGMINDVQHAFNIILNKNGNYYILDTSYCCGLYDKNSNNLGTVSYMFNLGGLNNDLEKFLFEGIEYNFDDGIARKNNNGVITFESNGRFRKYKIEPIRLVEEKNKSK